MEPVFVPGEPALFLTAREKEWKALVAQHCPVRLTRPRLGFTVASFRRRGHVFDLDNLTKPVLDVVGGAVESVWATVAEGQVPGVSIGEGTPPPPPRVDFRVSIADPPRRSVRTDQPLPELADVVPVGVNEHLGMRLALHGAQKIGDFGFEGPVKPLIDALAPVLGGRPGRPADHRIKDLRVVQGAADDGADVVLWVL